VTGRYGTLGEVFYLEEDYWPLNTALYVVDFKGTHPKFASYFLKHVLGNYQSDKAAVPGVDRNVLHELKVCCPEPDSQEHIASVLSVYDDLIENNRRRMALLEASARLLYREWFVRLCFPGHEQTHIVNGIPEGWETKALGDVFTLKRGYDLPESRRSEGQIPIVSSSGITGYHHEKRALAPGVVTGRYGTLGEVFFMQEDFWPLNTALYISDFKGTSPEFAAHLLRTVLAGMQSDKAAVPGLDRNVVHRVEVLFPPKLLRDQFSEFASLGYRQIFTLENWIRKLKAARDLLLPSLMSGEITV
jgi:type I restriction enzyme S subunit